MDRKKEAEMDEEEEEKGRRCKERAGESREASWVSISRIRAWREDSSGLEGGYRLHSRPCILLASRRQRARRSETSVHLDAAVSRRRQHRRKEGGKGRLWGFSGGHIRMLVAPRLSPWKVPPFISVSLGVLIPNMCQRW